MVCDSIQSFINLLSCSLLDYFCSRDSKQIKSAQFLCLIPRELSPTKSLRFRPDCRKSASLFSLPLSILNLRMSTQNNEAYYVTKFSCRILFSEILYLHISCNMTKYNFYLAYEISTLKKAKIYASTQPYN